ncbi:MAG: sugar phosphate isomerase/epimerase [Armatimonadetes bacterium]|nr:MAG: sugar phosphate isomerase/epimerase [Armatimonadota bacterium]
MMPPVVSLQLYTVREVAKRDLTGTLHALADIGYEYVELAGLYDQTPSDLARLLNEADLKVSGAHIPFESLRDNLLDVFQPYQELGAPEITVPYLPEQARSTPDQWRETASKLEMAADVAMQQGLEFSYHNHSFEFEAVGEQTGMSILVSETERLLFQPDVYWVAVGGEDPVQFLRDLRGRVRSVHIKDRGADGGDIEWGQGNLPHAAILDTCAEIGVRTLVLEMDNPRMDPIESARLCYAKLIEMMTPS